MKSHKTGDEHGSMFRGRFEHSIDGKGRLSVPARFREVLAQRFDGDMNLVVVPNERCLEVHPLSQWEASRGACA